MMEVLLLLLLLLLLREASPPSLPPPHHAAFPSPPPTRLPTQTVRLYVSSWLWPSELAPLSSDTRATVTLGGDLVNAVHGCILLPRSVDSSSRKLEENTAARKSRKLIRPLRHIDRRKGFCTVLSLHWCHNQKTVQLNTINSCLL